MLVEPLPEVLSRRIRRYRETPLIVLKKYIHSEHIKYFQQASHNLGLFVLIRRTNRESIKFVGWEGFVPKPKACAAKTATHDVDVELPGGGHMRSYCAGLVVDPIKVTDKAFGGPGRRYDAAINAWREWEKALPAGFLLQTDENSGYYGCVMRCTAGTRVGPHTSHEATCMHAETVAGSAGERGRQFLPDRDIDPHALSTLPPGCSYMHGDYDLYALIHRDHLSERYSQEGTVDGQSHVHSPYWEDFKAFMRVKINIDMIQHGSQEHFKDHTNEPVDMFCPAPERDLWVVTIRGAQGLRRLYRKVFRGRQPKQY